jgi:ribonuclease BN (tRNA processing enzyme)
VLAGLALAGVSADASAQAGKSRLILLGTGGGPTPKPNRAAPAQVIVVNGAAYVIDCGNGVARQMVLAKVPLASLRAVFLTHQHSDHNADYGNLIWLAWGASLAGKVDTYGPPPLEKMTRLFLEMNDYDIQTRMADEGRPPLAPLIAPHEITAAGPVMRDANVTVTAALVDHGAVKPAFAYRFDCPDRSIVISGDTRPTDSLVALARGADVLVQEVMYLPALETLVRGETNAKTLREHLLSAHTACADAGRIATRAGVKTLVLSHFVPGGDPAIPDQAWLEAVRPTFAGTIVVGRDLLEV